LLERKWFTGPVFWRKESGDRGHSTRARRQSRFEGKGLGESLEIALRDVWNQGGTLLYFHSAMDTTGQSMRADESRSRQLADYQND